MQGLILRLRGGGHNVRVDKHRIVNDLLGVHMHVVGNDNVGVAMNVLGNSGGANNALHGACRVCFAVCVAAATMSA